jgi:hypothetical protein
MGLQPRDSPRGVPGGVEFEIGIEHSGFAVRCPLPRPSRGFRAPSRLQGIRACERLVRPLHRPALVAGLAAWSDKSTNNRTSQQELHVSPEATRSVPAVAAVKQLASTWTQKGDDVLKIRRRAGGCSQSRRIERAALAGEEDEAEEAATDLEAARTDVLVWQTIAREVEDRP